MNLSNYDPQKSCNIGSGNKCRLYTSTFVAREEGWAVSENVCIGSRYIVERYDLERKENEG